MDFILIEIINRVNSLKYKSPGVKLGDIILIIISGDFMIHQLPFMQIQKQDGRAYIVLLPFNAPFEEAHEVMLEFAQQILEEKRIRQEMIDKEKLKEEIKNQTAEATVG